MFNILMEFSSKSLIILLVLLALVVIATIIVVIVENKKEKKEIDEAIKTIDNEIKVTPSPVAEEKKIEDKPVVVTVTPEEVTPVVEPVKEEQTEEIVLEEPKQETIYEEEKKEEEKKEEAKQELERLEKTLQEEKEERVGPTDFEIEQERTAIINYEELKQAAGTIETRDEKLLQDEGNEPISIDDLYDRVNLKKEPEIKEEIKEIKEEIKKEIPPISEEKKFKNSEVLSPVFGVTKEHKDLVRDVRHSEVMEAVDLEIAKTEKFLKELKELREKLY